MEVKRKVHRYWLFVPLLAKTGKVELEKMISFIDKTIRRGGRTDGRKHFEVVLELRMESVILCVVEVFLKSFRRPRFAEVFSTFGKIDCVVELAR